MPMESDLVESPSAVLPNRRESLRNERRKSPRKDMLNVGVIVYGSGHRKMYCVLLNISDGGARLVPADLCNCPDRFSLSITNQFARECQIVWRDRSRVGVKFT